MQINPFTGKLGAALLCAGLSLVAGSCMTDDYDLNNVDLTMGLGSEGLAVKIGATDKVLLGDILKVDETIKLDHENLYYLVKDGESNFNINVDPVTATFDESTVSTSQTVLSYDQALEQSGHTDKDVTSFLVKTDSGPFSGKASGESTTDFTVDNITSDIISVSEAVAEEKEVTMTINMLRSRPEIKFHIDRIENFKFKLPKFVRIKAIKTEGWTFNANNELIHPAPLKVTEGQPICRVVIDRIVMGDKGVPVDGTIRFEGDMAYASMSGDVFFYTSEDFTIHEGDYADVELKLELSGGSEISIKSVTGVFDPKINPEVEPIHIADDLPDFLQDDAVRVKVNNPTLKFQTDMTQIPVGLDFSADLKSVKTGSAGFTKNVTLPVTQIAAHEAKTIYYYQGDAPYDPTADPTDCEKQQVDNLGTLIEQLPDEIQVNLGDGRVKVQRKEFTVDLGNNYKATANYSVYVPFAFDKGLVIVYNDSTNNLNEDLKDYGAKGLRVTAKVSNTIPLELLTSITAVDENEKPISGITFSEATIKASADGVTPTESEVQLDGTLTDPMLLSKVARFHFKVRAEGVNEGNAHKLLSTQYLQFNDIRLRLKGQIIGDFN